MPESIPTAELLATAAVTLNRHKKLLSELGALFDSAGFDLYLVGGSVRDAALGKPGIDLDFTTDARPEQVKNLMTGWAEAIWDTGIAFGTIGVARRGQRVEITTFRSDSYDQQSRNPEVVFGDSLEGDLVRRDFTVNAMAVKIGPDGPGEFCDPLNGLEALRAGVLDTRRRRRFRSAMTRCGCCARPDSCRNWASRWRRACWRRCTRWPISWAGSLPNVCRPNWTS